MKLNKAVTNTGTDNSHFELKVKLRLEHLPDADPVNVLDLFSGDGLLWTEVIKRTKKNINTLKIDIKPGKKGIDLKGDNLKFLNSLDLNDFDCIDVDAYGVPYKQLKEILTRNYKGIIFITYIQSVFGKLPKKMLMDLNYTAAMIRKVPTLFDRNGLVKLNNWLSLYDIKKVKRFSIERKHYLVINY